MLVKDLQSHLRLHGDYEGEVNGVYDKATYEGSLRFLFAHTDLEREEVWQWDPLRVRVAAMQSICKDLHIDVGPIDGYIGPQTEYAFHTFMLRKHGYDDESWRDYRSPKSNWPYEADVEDYYGEKGENQVRIQTPYPHIISWDKTRIINSFFCHEKVHDSLLRCLLQIRKEYGIKNIDNLGLNLFGGCLNVRKKRGGSTWSMHSWGIAVDYHPEKNKYRWGRDKAVFAKPEYQAFWEIWEREGWTSLGRQRNYDWMHVQAAKLNP